jgi:hypothetical protein
MKIHKSFFANFEKKINISSGGYHNGLLTDIRYYIDRCRIQIFESNFIVNFQYFIQWHTVKKENFKILEK